MTEFSIDAEPLTFSGPAPVSLALLIAAVEPVLHERGRVLVEVVVDGAICAESVSAEAWSVARRVEVHSLTVAEAISRLAADIVMRVDALLPELERLASDVLVHPWSEIADACVALATRIGELMAGAQGLIQEVPAILPAVDSVATCVHRWIAGIESRDAAVVCLALDSGVIPALKAFRERFEGMGSER